MRSFKRDNSLFLVDGEFLEFGAGCNFLVTGGQKVATVLKKVQTLQYLDVSSKKLGGLLSFYLKVDSLFRAA